jgi:hypothetical protein
LPVRDLLLGQSGSPLLTLTGRKPPREDADRRGPRRHPHETCFALRWSWAPLASTVAAHLGARHLTLTALTPVRVITRVAVFACSVLAGAGNAAWLMLPS